MTTTDETVSEQPSTVQKLLAEFLGTFVLVFIGVGSAVLGGATGLNIAAVGLAFGLAVMMMAYAVGNISGGHFNPAVTLGAAVSGRIGWMDVPLYMAAQLVGAVVGAGGLLVVMKGFEDFDAFEGPFGANTWGDESELGISWWGAGLLELILTFIFLMVILAVTDSRFQHPALAPVTIGLTLAAVHFVAIPITGTSVNPARSLGPALFSGTDVLLQQWLFVIFPLLGGALAGLLYPVLFGADSPLGRLRSLQAPRDDFQAEWNQQQWGQPGASGAQQWQSQPQQQAWGQQPAQAQPAQTGEPSQPGYQPQAAPEQQGWPQGQGQQWQQGGQQWGQPDGGDEGRTQIRPQQ